MVGIVFDRRFRFEFVASSSRFSVATLQLLADFFASELTALSVHLAGRLESELTPSDIDYDGFTVDKLDQFLERL